MSTLKSKRVLLFLIASMTLFFVALVLWWTLRTEPSSADLSLSPFAHPGLLKPGELDGLTPQESVEAIQRDAKARLSLYNLAMANRPLKASGIVVDEDGTPIAGAMVGYYSARLTGWTERRRLLSKHDGTFEIVGEDGMEMQVTASHDEYINLPSSSVFVAPRASLLGRDGAAVSGGFVSLVLRKKPPSAGLKPVNARREFDPESWVLSFDMGTGRTRVGEPTGPQEIGFYLELGEGAIPFERSFDWKVTLRIPGGGAQIRTG
jgi:hypothetical protein